MTDDQRAPRLSLTYEDAYGFEYYGNLGEECKKWQENFEPEIVHRREKLDKFLKNTKLLEDSAPMINIIKLQDLYRKGLYTKDPMERGMLWAYALGALHLQSSHPKVYSAALETELSDKTNEDIECDIRRSVVNHPRFRENGENSLVPTLRKVLRAIAAHIPLVGYVQGMNITCGTLLIFMPEELCFWSMAVILQGSRLTRHKWDLGFEHYYTPKMELLFCDLKILRELLMSRKKGREVILWLEENDVSCDHLFVKWLLTLTAGALPMTTVVRIWDSFFCEGIKVFFRIIVVVLESNKDKLLTARGIEAVMDEWKQITENLFDHEFLIKAALKVQGSEFKRRRIHTPLRLKLTAAGSHTDVSQEVPHVACGCVKPAR